MGIRGIAESGTVTSIANAVWGADTNFNNMITAFPTQTFPLSISFWVKIERNLNSAHAMNLLIFGDVGLSSMLSITYYPNPGSGGFGLVTNTGGGPVTAYSNVYTSIGNWRHVCLSYATSTSRQLYLDGNRIVNSTDAFSLTNITECYSGSNSTTYTGSGFHGYQIAELTLFDRALGVNSVKALSGGATISAKPTYHLDLIEPYKSSFTGGAGNLSKNGINDARSYRDVNVYDYPTVSRINPTFYSQQLRRRLFVVS